MHSKIIKERFELYSEFTEFDIERICEAFELFAEPYEDQWSMVGTIKDKKKKTAPLKNARNTIAKTMEGSPDIDEMLRSIDARIFWEGVSIADIKSQFTNRAIAVLSPHFTKAKTKEILTVFRELIEEI